MTARPVGLSRDLSEGRVMLAEADGVDMVVWRDGEGRIAAWDNRCPHRGMRLSHGFVRGGGLTCLYHGWRYGPNGRCNLIPAHPDLEPPETIGVKVYGCVEAQGVIWVDPVGDAAPSGAPEGFAPLRTLTILCSEEGVRRAAPMTPAGYGETPAERPGAIYASADWTVAFLYNPIGPARTQVTVLINAEASTTARRSASRWCEALRRGAEQAEEVVQ